VVVGRAPLICKIRLPEIGESRKDMNECKNAIKVDRESKGVRGPYRKGLSKQYIFFNFVATLKKYSRQEFDTGIFYYGHRLV